MARSWSGFVPQNQNVKEQWRVLEASQAEIVHMLEMIEADENDAPPGVQDEAEAESLAEDRRHNPF